MKKSSTFLRAAGHSLFKIIGRSLYAATLTIALILPKFIQAQQTDIPRGMIMFGDAKAVYGQMWDSLGINWVQGYTGVGNEHIGPGTNTVGFKVIACRANLDLVSTAQHMEYPAYKTNLTFDWSQNFFAAHGPGGTATDGGTRYGESAWYCQKGVYQAGVMVSSPMPDNEFHYGHTNYIATFRLKIDDKSNPSWNVVTLHVKGLDNNRNVLYDSVKTLTEDSFATATNYQTFQKSFTIPQQPGSQHVDIKAGRPHVMTASPAVSHIDISVYWYDNVNTWLDYVDVDDSTSLNLFAGAYDDTIRDDVNGYLSGGYPLMQRLYLRDEPFVPSFLPYHYVDAYLKNNIFGDALRGRGITETFWAQNSIIFNRFLQEARPCETIYESGPLIDADIPSPSFRDAYYQDLIDDWQGVAPYISDADYISKMQTQFNNVIDANFKVAAELTSSKSVQFWFSPHLDGSFHRSTGQYRWTQDPYHWRPPIAIELRALVNTALAYGAKAILAYPYTGNPEQTDYELFYPGLVSQALSPDGLKHNHWSNIESISCWNNNDPNSLYSKNVYTGYSEKWDELSALNKRLGLIGPTLASIAWQGTKSWGMGLTAGTWANKISSVTTNISGENVYVETGHFTGANCDYFYIVNRRTLASEGRNITVRLAFPSGSWDVSDVASSNAWVIPGTGSFTDSFAPGEGKLYKVASANYSASRTIPAGATFRLSAGVTLNFSSGTILTVNGTLLASGTSSQHIVFTGPTSYWQGVVINNSGSSSLQYCDFCYAHEPICATNCSNLALDHCTFQNSDFYGTDAAGLRFYNSSPNISYCTLNGLTGTVNSCSGVRFAQGSTGSLRNSTIRNLGAGHGIIIQGNSAPTISGNNIRSVHYYGIILNGNGTACPDIFGNTFDSCGTYGNGRHYGAIYLYQSTATIRTNSMTNGLFGILCDANSSPTSGNLHPGSNIITNNTHGIIAYNGSNPIIGLTRTRVVGQITYYDGACNHILDNSNYNVYTSGSCVVGVKRNWWGSNPPNTSKFYAINSSVIQYNPWSLSENDECWESGGPLLATGAQPVTTPEDSILQNALDARFNGSYAEAVKVYGSALDGNFTDEFKEKALSGMFDVYRDSKDASVNSFVESCLMQANNLGNLGKATMRILVIMCSSSGRYDQARDIAQNLRTRYPDAVTEKFVLRTLAMLGGYSESERAISQSAIGQIKAKYTSPEDEAFLAALGVSAGEENAEPIAQETKEVNLSGYPNPFNPSARIEFSLVKAGVVSLRVYDILGREVASLLNETKQPGTHVVTWNAGSMPSGVYFMRLSVAGKSVVKKMLLLK